MQTHEVLLNFVYASARARQSSPASAAKLKSEVRSHWNLLKI